MASMIVLLVAIFSRIYVCNGQCSYVNYFGWPQPTEVCSYVGESGSTKFSYQFHCGPSGIEYQYYDNKYCQGEPLSTTALNSGDAPNEYDHNCNGSPDDCTTAEYIIDYKNCDSESTNDYYIKFIFATQICSPENQDSSTFVKCGEVQQYDNNDCSGTPTSFLDTTTSQCGITWNCDVDTEETTTTTASPSIINKAKEQVSKLSSGAIAGIIVGILCCVCCTLICMYCACCKSKNRKKQLNNNYVQMRDENKPKKLVIQQPNVQYVPLVIQQPQQPQPQPVQLINDDNYSIPSAPKMSSVNENIKYNQYNDDDASSLPYGWNKAITDNGKMYYQNSITKETQWNKPDMLPHGWSIAYTNDNRMYYQNDTTKQTQWTHPNLNRMSTTGQEGGGLIINNNDHFEVKTFFNDSLKDMLLHDDKEKYIKLFILNGFTKLDDIKKLNDQMLMDMGINKIDHRKIILHALQIYHV